MANFGGTSLDNDLSDFENLVLETTPWLLDMALDANFDVDRADIRVTKTDIVYFLYEIFRTRKESRRFVNTVFNLFSGLIASCLKQIDNKLG